jgi:hypothetical protein
MNRVKYISHKLENNVDDIKALALYFDHIDVVEQNNLHILAPVEPKPNSKGKVKVEVIETRDYTKDLFWKHLHELEQESIISYSKHIENPPDSPKGLHSISNNTVLNNLIITHQDVIGKSKELSRKIEKDGRTIIDLEIEYNKEAIEVTKGFFSKEKDASSLMIYYGRLFSSFLDNIEKGENIITTSKFVNNLYHLAKQNNAFNDVSKEFKRELNVSPSIAYEAIKLNVPNIGSHPTSEILEFRLKSKDELEGFRRTLENLTVGLLDKYDEAYINENAQKLVELKVQPLLKDIESKLKESKFKAFQQIVKEAKNPSSYSPLLLSLSDNVSSTMALMVSLGLISLNVGLEYYKNTKGVSKDGIYYLMKLNKYYA